jgi:glycosyltransferase involved in cell wall biosynthesis
LLDGDKEMNKLVTIVLPVHNGIQYLAQSIESCLNQTYQNVELIIVDDCSTDESPACIEKYANSDRRVRVITNETNKRLPASLNIGFSYSSGDYLTWTSDDNYYDDNAIETMMNYLDNHANVGFVYADMKIIDSRQGSIRYNRGIGNYGSVSDLLICDVVGACFMYRRSVYEKIGEYDVSRELIEDWDYWVRVSFEYDIHHIPRNLYTYRAHLDSLTGRKQNEQLVKSIEYILYNNFENAKKIPDDIRMRSLLFATGIAKKIENKELARKCFSLAMDISPDAMRYTSKELEKYAAC